MEFLELSIASLQDESVKLAKLAEADGYKPDCVAYLAKGGWLIGEAVAKYFDVPIFELSAKRSGDSAKSFIAPVLQKLPRSLKKTLREIEIKRSKNSGGDAQRESLHMTERYTAPTNPSYIFLVDDAADSGASIDAAIAFLNELYPRAVIKTGLINAFDEACAKTQIDWALHKNTMLSLPSSKDNSDYQAFCSLYKGLHLNGANQ